MVLLILNVCLFLKKKVTPLHNSNAFTKFIGIDIL
jgi:hypothetical protein